MKLKTLTLAISLMLPTNGGTDVPSVEQFREAISLAIHTTAQVTFLRAKRGDSYDEIERDIITDWGPFTGPVHLVKKLDGRFYLAPGKED